MTAITFIQKKGLKTINFLPSIELNSKKIVRITALLAAIYFLRQAVRPTNNFFQGAHQRVVSFLSYIDLDSKKIMRIVAYVIAIYFLKQFVWPTMSSIIYFLIAVTVTKSSLKNTPLKICERNTPCISESDESKKLTPTDVARVLKDKETELDSTNKEETSNFGEREEGMSFDVFEGSEDPEKSEDVLLVGLDRDALLVGLNRTLLDYVKTTPDSDHISLNRAKGILRCVQSTPDNAQLIFHCAKMNPERTNRILKDVRSMLKHGKKIALNENSDRSTKQVKLDILVFLMEKIICSSAKMILDFANRTPEKGDVNFARIDFESARRILQLSEENLGNKTMPFKDGNATTSKYAIDNAIFGCEKIILNSGDTIFDCVKRHEKFAQASFVRSRL